MTLSAGGTLRLRVPPEIYWTGIRITPSDGQEIHPCYGDWQEGSLCLEQLPPGPLRIDFISDPEGRVTASCTDRATVIPWR